MHMAKTAARLSETAALDNDQPFVVTTIVPERHACMSKPQSRKKHAD